LPAASLSSLIYFSFNNSSYPGKGTKVLNKVINEANIGVVALVPAFMVKFSSIKTAILSPLALTSRIP
jgi:hypothetical protein